MSFFLFFAVGCMVIKKLRIRSCVQLHCFLIIFPTIKYLAIFFVYTVIPRYVARIGPEPFYGEKRGGEINELTH